MRGNLGDAAWLEHIYDAILEIENYILDVDFVEFASNSMMIYACIKQLEIIGEASNHLSDEIKVANNTIEWRQIIGMRNIFVHEYFGVDNHLVWDVIQNDLKHFRHTVEMMRENVNPSNK